jgi:hypothetical protein
MSVFLSDDWFRAVEGARQDFDDLVAPPGAEDLSIDLRIVDAPDGTIRVALAPGPTGLELQQAAVDAPTIVTMPYAVARAFFVDADFSAAMEAFVGGQILVEGDLATLMALQGPVSSRHQELQARIKALTE